MFKAVALRGNGVIETFLGLMRVTWNELEKAHGLEQKFQISGDEVIESLRTHLGVLETQDVAEESGR